MIDHKEFIETIFSELNEGELVCLSKQMDNWFLNFMEKDRAWRRWSPEKDASPIYFCVSTVDGELNVKGSMPGRGRKNLLRAHVLVLDDIGTKTAAPDVAPSYILESSEGNFQWGYFLAPTTDMALYEALIGAIHGLGWGDGGAGGSYRVMRVPGSANIKPGRGEFRSRVASWTPDRVWTLAELAAAFGLDLDALPVAAALGAVAVAGVAPVGGVDVLLTWLGENDQVVADDGGAWVRIKCPWSGEHTGGDGTAGYSALGRGGDDWEVSRSFHCMHEHCKGRKLGDLLGVHVGAGAPVVAGYDPLPVVQARYLYIGMGQQVADMEQRKRGGEWVWELADWAKLHSGKVSMPGQDGKVSLANAFIGSRKTQKVVNPIYVPVRRGSDVGVVEALGQKSLNIYVPPRWDEVAGVPEIFLSHIEYLLPDAGEQDIFLDWLAFKIQNPDQRSYAIVMVADEVYGTGRSWLKSMLEMAIQGGVNTATLPQLIGRGTGSEQSYTDWMSRAQFLVIEEAKDALVDRDIFYNSYETFKIHVDPMVRHDVRINPKYGRTRMESIYFNCLIFTNHRDALAFPENDRRVCVLTNAGEMNTSEYYDRLQGSLNRVEAAKIYWWMMRRDVSSYDHVYPPMTPAKEAMIEVNRSPAEQVLEHIIDTNVSDLVTQKGLRLLVQQAASHHQLDGIEAKPGPVTKHIWAKLGTLRQVRNGLRISTKTGQEGVRAIRNKKRWQSAGAIGDAGTAQKEYLRGAAPIAL